MPETCQCVLNKTKEASKGRGLKKDEAFPINVTEAQICGLSLMLTPHSCRLLAPKAAIPEWGCRGGSARRVKPPSEQKNKFHLVAGTKRQPAKPPARAPAQRTHCFLKFQLVAASIYKSTSSPHPELRAGFANGSKTFSSEYRHMNMPSHSGCPAPSLARACG